MNDECGGLLIADYSLLCPVLLLFFAAISTDDEGIATQRRCYEKLELIFNKNLNLIYNKVTHY